MLYASALRRHGSATIPVRTARGPYYEMAEPRRGQLVCYQWERDAMVHCALCFKARGTEDA